jgi:hypothetical protein
LKEKAGKIFEEAFNESPIVMSISTREEGRNLEVNKVFLGCSDTNAQCASVKVLEGCDRAFWIDDSTK